MIEARSGVAADFDRQLAMALQSHQRGELDRALALYRHLSSLDPHRADIHHFAGLVLTAQRQGAAAVDAFRRAIAIDPGLAAAHADLGFVLWKIGQIDDAIAAYRRAIALAPDHVPSYVNLGVALARQGETEDAMACLSKAIALAPDNADAHYRLARLHADHGDDASAIAAYRACLTNVPEHEEAKFHYALAALRQGDFAQAWPFYETRLCRPEIATPLDQFPQALWRGEDLADRAILAWGEQGVGEEVMFASMIPDLAARAGRCVVACEPRLVPLFARSFGSVDVIPRSVPPDAAMTSADLNYQVPIGNLGRWLRPSAASFDAATAYLKPDPTAAADIRRRYAGNGPVIGIAWRSTGANTGFSAEKSSTLADWGSILRAPNCRFINLQYGDVAAERIEAEVRHGVPVTDDTSVDQKTDLDLFAAQVAALDLVITTANTTAHIAGAIGQTVWLLLPEPADWRWGRTGTDSLWYPGMRIFRQPSPGDWAGLLSEVKAALLDWLTAREVAS